MKTYITTATVGKNLLKQCEVGKEYYLYVGRHAAILLLIQVVAAVFGYTLDLGDLGNKLLDVVNAVFAVLVILGVVTDPTTKGITDSDQALTYTEPKK